MTGEPLSSPVFSFQLRGHRVSGRSLGPFVLKETRELFENRERELNKRRYQRAAEHLDRALSIAPGFADPLHYTRALIYLQENDLPRSREFFEKAIASNPQLGDSHIALGRALTRQGHFEPAIEPLTKGLGMEVVHWLLSFPQNLSG